MSIKSLAGLCTQKKSCASCFTWFLDPNFYNVKNLDLQFQIQGWTTVKNQGSYIKLFCYRLKINSK